MCEGKCFPDIWWISFEILILPGHLLKVQIFIGVASRMSKLRKSILYTMHKLIQWTVNCLCIEMLIAWIFDGR